MLTHRENYNYFTLRIRTCYTHIQYREIILILRRKQFYSGKQHGEYCFTFVLIISLHGFHVD